MKRLKNKLSKPQSYRINFTLKARSVNREISITTLQLYASSLKLTALEILREELLVLKADFLASPLP